MKINFYNSFDHLIIIFLNLSSSHSSDLKLNTGMTFLALLIILVSLITLVSSHDPCDCIDDLIEGTEVTVIIILQFFYLKDLPVKSVFGNKSKDRFLGLIYNFLGFSLYFFIYNKPYFLSLFVEKLRAFNCAQTLLEFTHQNIFASIFHYIAEIKVNQRT